MNHKLAMHKLEEKKRDLLEKSVALHKEISEVDALIKKNRRAYLLANKNAEECSQILKSYNKENIREILKFVLIANVAGGSPGSEYAMRYKDIDMELLLKDDDFFDFLIVSIGRPTIVDLKKSMVGVVVKDGEQFLETNGIKRFNDNSRLRLFKKLTKSVVVRKAKEMQDGHNKEG